MAKKFSNETVEQWKELYQAGHTLEQIAAAFSTSGKTVSKHIKKNGTSHPKSNEQGSIPDANGLLDTDPEILALLKQLKISELKRRIREAESPLDIENRLAKIERRLSEHDNQFSNAAEWIEWFDQSIENLDQNLAIRAANYQCSCGAQGEMSVYCRCKKCYAEHWLG